MNNVSINDEEFVNSSAYQDFLNTNKGRGYLKIRAYAANQAIPISGLKILVNKKIDGYNVNFLKGILMNQVLLKILVCLHKNKVIMIL